MSSPAVDALRHAAPDAYIVLDDEDRITHVSARLHDDFGRWIGHVLWEHLPGARDVYGPTFDEARTSGRPVESVVFYSGRVKRLTVIPGADGLAVHVERLARAGRQDSRDVDSEPGADRGCASWSSVRATRFTSSRVSASSSLSAASSTACAVAASGARTRSLTVVSVISAILRRRASDGVGDAPFPARDRDRLDAELLGKLLLGQADAAPRSAQSPPHSAAFVGAQTALLIPDGAAGCVAIP